MISLLLPCFLEDSLDSVHNPCIHMLDKMMTFARCNVVDGVEGYSVMSHGITDEPTAPIIQFCSTGLSIIIY